jgi:glycine dehydrogenase subunit 1
MPFIPHTDHDIQEMLAAIGVSDIEELFGEIPEALRIQGIPELPPGITEMEITRLMQRRAQQDGRPLCFIGAGAYEHHIPAAVWEIATRGEFYSAYTPYQAEASQGTLQVIYEYQSMMATLTGMDFSNASLYDGASALAEAILMAVRANRRVKSKRILMPQTVHPIYRKVARTIVRHQHIELVEIPFNLAGGHITPETLEQYAGQEFTGLVIPQPNFFGILEEVDALTDWAHAQGGLVIGVVNPVALAILAPPGDWGAEGADIVVGEGQPLGMPLASGGPYVGFMGCKQPWVRQMPGRLVGQTVDIEGRTGYTLTLQAREQHIRRSKATSNICTNQGLMAIAATIHMALLGPQGLAQVAAACHRNTRRLVEKLTAVEGVEQVFERPFFHEAVIRLGPPAHEVLRALGAQNVLAGYRLADDYPEVGNCILTCATETKTDEDVDTYAAHLERILRKRKVHVCPIKPKI